MMQCSRKTKNKRMTVARHPFEVFIFEASAIFYPFASFNMRIPVKRRARSGGTVRSFQCKRRSRSIPNGVKRRPFVLSGQRPQFLTELRPLVS